MTDTVVFTVIIAGMSLMVLYAIWGWTRAERRANALEHEVMLKDALLKQQHPVAPGVRNIMLSARD